jgi:hypothetical protein
VRKKKDPKKNQPRLRKGKKKGQLEFTTLVSPGRDQKGAPIGAPSIHIGALVGAGSLWPLPTFRLLAYAAWPPPSLT